MSPSVTISRRQLLTAAVAVPFLGVAGTAKAWSPQRKATFVLVHGAWHGGWCWARISPLLRAAGHDVVAPSLTGLGERSHLLKPEIDLSTHITDIVSVLQYEDLQNVVLVGHSYGGMVITGVAEAAPSQVAHLVYLDAFLPVDGKALADYAPVPPRRDDGWRIPPPGSAPRFGVTEERDVAWMEARLGDQPLRTFTQPVMTPSKRGESMPRTFIQCTEAPWFSEAAGRAQAQGFRVHELLGAGHNAMITQPGELGRVLLEST
jgi:pimeloyl-ACP methyl ester carboxylesterase